MGEENILFCPGIRKPYPYISDRLALADCVKLVEGKQSLRECMRASCSKQS